MALDVAIYEEVEGDRGATTQAFAVVILSSMPAGLAARLAEQHRRATSRSSRIVSLLAWAAWALVTFEIGVRLMPEPQTRADVGELLRTIGFASTPGMLRVLGVLPVATIRSLSSPRLDALAMVVAVRQALDYRSTARAVAVCVLGWVCVGVRGRARTAVRGLGFYVTAAKPQA